jgi:hypothetical protein
MDWLRDAKESHLADWNKLPTSVRSVLIILGTLIGSGLAIYLACLISYEMGCLAIYIFNSDLILKCSVSMSGGKMIGVSTIGLLIIILISLGIFGLFVWYGSLKGHMDGEITTNSTIDVDTESLIQGEMK